MKSAYKKDTEKRDLIKKMTRTCQRGRKHSGTRSPRSDFVTDGARWVICAGSWGLPQCDTEHELDFVPTGFW